MADYPSITQRIGTLRESSSGMRVNRALSGKPLFSRFSIQDWYAFKVQHECSTADKTTILSHYATHRMLEFAFLYTATDETYQVQYAEAPRIQTLDGEDHWLVETHLVDTGRLPYGIALFRSTANLVVTGESTSRGRVISIPVASTVTVGTPTLAKTKEVSVSVASSVVSTGVQS